MKTNGTKEERRPSRRFSDRSIVWKLFAILLANLFLFVLFLFAGEAFLRLYYSWKEHGKGKANWLVPDKDLGYKLNPASEKFNTIGICHDELELDKPEGLFRVIVLGDSVAFPEDGFVAILRQRLSEIPYSSFEVINASIPGYTTYQERLLLQRDLIRFSPDLVILQYCLNDNHKFLHRLNEKRQWLMTEEAWRALLPSEDNWFSRLTESSYMIFEIRLRLHRVQARLAKGRNFPWEKSRAFVAAWQDKTWEQFEKHIVAIRDILLSSGARLVVVAVPFGPQLEWEHLERDRGYTLFPQARLREICENAWVPLLDLHPIFSASSGTGLFIDNIHLTDEGHRLTAVSLFDFLEKQGLLPEKPK